MCNRLGYDPFAPYVYGSRILQHSTRMCSCDTQLTIHPCNPTCYLENVTEMAFEAGTASLERVA